MKKTIALGVLILIPFLFGTAFAGIYNAPEVSLEHSRVYYWGINASTDQTDLIAGYEVKWAKLILNGLNNSEDNNPPQDDDHLYINLVDNNSDWFNWSTSVKNGMSQSWFTDGDGDWFGYGIDLLTTQDDNADWVGGTWVNPPQYLEYSFNELQLGTLEDYILNNGYIGIGLDPDCHYSYSGLQLAVGLGPTGTPNAAIPEPGTMALLGIGLVFFGATRKKFKRS